MGEFTGRVAASAHDDAVVFRAYRLHLRLVLRACRWLMFKEAHVDSSGHGVSADWSRWGWPAYRYADFSARVVAVSGAHGAGFRRVPGRAAEARPGLQRDRRKRSRRDRRRGLDAPPAEPAGVVPDRARPGALRHGRRARLQLPRAVRHGVAVPVDRGPAVSGGLPDHARGAAAADPPTQRRTRLGQPDRRGDRDDRSRTAVVGLPDGALRA
jgi:hypothetical protein